MSDRRMDLSKEIFILVRILYREAITMVEEDRIGETIESENEEVLPENAVVLDEPEESRIPYEEDCRCPPDSHFVRSFRRRDGTRVRSHCVRNAFPPSQTFIPISKYLRQKNQDYGSSISTSIQNMNTD